MKKLSLLALALGFYFGAGAQCSLSGLQSFYCSEDAPSTLSATCNGTPTILGPGVSGSTFDPSQAGSGAIEIYVLDGGATYTIDQSGSFDTIGPPSNATTVSLSDDAVATSLPIGFTFRFFEDQYTTFGISSNGFVFFGSNSDNGCCSGDYMPSTGTPNNVIAFAWEDLDPNGGNDGTISYWTHGTAPNRRCIIDFDAVPHYPGTGNFVTSQVHLFEGCGRIEIHTTSMPSDGGSHTMGIENSNGSTAFPVSGRNSSSWTISNDFVAFLPNCGDTFTTYVSAGPDIVFAIDTMDCFGDTDGEIVANATGFSPFTYAWSTSGTTNTISNLSNGTYTLTATDSAGCVGVHEVEMLSPDPLGALPDIVDNDCEGGLAGEVHIVGIGGTPPFSYAWSNGGTGASQTGLAVGNYTVSMTDANGCTTNLGVDVDFVNADPQIDLGDDKTICPGQTVVLLADVGYPAYEWSDGSTTNSLVVNQAGTYAVTATSSEGCDAADTIVVLDVLPDQVDLGANMEGLGPIFIGAGAQYTSYLWNTGSTSQTLAITISGTYSITVVDTNGCNSMDEVTVKIWPTGVQAPSTNGLMVYPNPATEFVTVKADQVRDNVTVRITDMTGREVMNQVVTLHTGEEVNMNVSDLSPGNYMLILSNDAFKEERIIQIQ